MVLPMLTQLLSSWSEITEVNTGRKQATSFSGSPAPTMIFVGGASASTVYSNVETYNGTSWTEITDLNTARFALGGAGQAQTDGLVFGGDVPGNTAATENWNGTTWTELADLSTARSSLVGSGTGATSALATGGYTTTYAANTEEWTVAPPASFQQENLGQVFYNSTSDAFKVTQQPVSGGTWASGGSLNTARNFLSGSGAGTQTSSIAFGGNTGSVSALTENYNGTSWTEVNDLNTARNGLAGFGTATAAIGADSRSPLAGTDVESWNGTSWTEIAENNTGRSLARGFGVQTAGNIVGGTDNSPGSSVLNLNEYWNGSTWTELADLNTARHSLGASGVYTAGLDSSNRRMDSTNSKQYTNSELIWQIIKT
jgi:hypothetical protein